jgi:hypothetical protein
MAANTGHSSGTFGGLIAGFICLSMFGVATWVVFARNQPKSALEIIKDGDFSEKKSKERTRLASLVESEQNGAANLKKIGAEKAAIKSSPPGPSAIVVPGSPTALKAAQPAPTPPPAAPVVTPAPPVVNPPVPTPPVKEIKVSPPVVKAVAPKAVAPVTPEVKKAEPAAQSGAKANAKKVESAPKPEVKAEVKKSEPVVE